MSQNKHIYFLQSSARPKPENYPGINKGFMILVNSKPCQYGVLCYRNRYSVSLYSQGGEYYGKGSHQPIHWHIAPNAKWTNGRQEISFL